MKLQGIYYFLLLIKKHHPLNLATLRDQRGMSLQ